MTTTHTTKRSTSARRKRSTSAQPLLTPREMQKRRDLKLTEAIRRPVDPDPDDVAPSAPTSTPAAPQVQTLGTAELAHGFAPKSSATPNDGGLAAALDAAAKVDGSELAAGTSAGTSAGTAPGAQPIATPDPVAATMATAEMLFTLSISTLARLQGVTLTPEEFERVAKLDARERAVLASYAPMAAPFVAKAIQATPALGLVAFAGALIMPAANRLGQIRTIRAARPPKSRASAGTAPARPLTADEARAQLDKPNVAAPPKPA